MAGACVGSADFLISDHRRLLTATSLYQTLKAKHFLFDDESAPLLDVLATKYRTKKAFLELGVTLHIMVLTLRCAHSCHYCQVSRQTPDRTTYDMSTATIERSLSFMMQFPSEHLTLEFQGGEPLLAFDRLQYAVRTAKELAAKHGKTLSIVVCTNLAVATDEMLALSPRRGHQNKYLPSMARPSSTTPTGVRSGENSYDVTIANINRARAYVGHENVGALMTASRFSLGTRARSWTNTATRVWKYLSARDQPVWLRNKNRGSRDILRGVLAVLHDRA